MDNMADGAVRQDSCVSTFLSNRCEIQEVNCISCEELSLELLQAKTKILSLEKIIKMLQVELNMTRQEGRSNLQEDLESVDAVTTLQVAVNKVHVEEACAQLLKTPMNVSPKRFRVNSHPEDDQKDNSQISLPNQPRAGSLGKRCSKIPTIINGSIIMDASDTLQKNHGRSTIIKNSTSTESIKPTRIVQHKVLMLGDSHLKGSVVKLRSELSPKFKVFGVIRPGAGAEQIVNSSAEDLQNLHSHDIVVLNAGANDVYKNNKGVALTQITKFIQRNYGTNIIILDIPQRYALSSSSRVNSEIEEFSRQLKKIATLYNHVSLLETNLKRECFTKHGLHWNSLGKTLDFCLYGYMENKGNE
ncbi:uncharacterized protein LOC117282525 [Cryptotermes secundus]|uniref:uncharacterized protein LOC117282525 n=1 Tax=Cryptotermes secundus TaxID=105785 RepID=UPI001454BF28|nr:uncharacterized protein LOC117282525 [Cryptotermes secundus]